MSSLRYRVTAISDVLLAQSSGERNTVSTYDYIPGTTMLGIFAARYIRSKNLNSKANEDESFRSIFLDGSVKFANCYLVGKDLTGKDINYLPLPKALSHEKRNNESYCNQLADGEQENHKLADGYGLYKDNKIVLGSVEKTLNFHHERDPETGSSKKGMIFNYEAIKSGTVFEGELLGEQSTLDMLKALISETDTIYAGRSKSAQYGAVKIKFLEEPGIQTNVSDTERVSITLISDLIIYNDFGSPTSDYREIEKYLRSKINKNLSIEKTYLSQTSFENFVSHWRLKKPLETCFAKGSCLVINGLDKITFDNLKNLALTGLGERTGEGFGRVRIDYPATVSNGIIKNETKIKEEVSRPEGTVPQEVKNIAIKIIHNEAIKKATMYGADKGILINGWSTSFPGKLWGIFLEMKKDKAKFIAELKKLPANTKNKLTDKYIDNNTIMDFLEKDEKYLVKFNEFGIISTKLGLSVNDYTNSKDLFASFLKSFLNSARRKAKEDAEDKKKQGGQN